MAMLGMVLIGILPASESSKVNPGSEIISGKLFVWGQTVFRTVGGNSYWRRKPMLPALITSPTSPTNEAKDASEKTVYFIDELGPDMYDKQNTPPSQLLTDDDEKNYVVGVICTMLVLLLLPAAMMFVYLIFSPDAFTNGMTVRPDLP